MKKQPFAFIPGKKILPTVGLLLFSAGSTDGFAAGMDITLGGHHDAQWGWAKQRPGLSTPGLGGVDSGLSNHTYLDLTASSRTDSGLAYGAVIRHEENPSPAPDGFPGTTIPSEYERSYLFAETPMYGRVELGSNVGVQSTMKVDASNIARATGGIDGDWLYYVNTFFAFYQMAGPIRPELPTGNGENILQSSEKNANKVSYYSPAYEGVQLGISYTRDTGDRGTAAGFTTDNDRSPFIDQEDLVGVAVKTDHELGGGFALQTSLTAERGSAESRFDRDTEAWAAGASISYEGFSLAGSYGDWGKSFRSESASYEPGSSDFYTLGTAYGSGPFGVSLTYMHSRGNQVISSGWMQHGTFDLLSLGVDYTLAPGLTLYAEGSSYDIEMRNNFRPGAPIIFTNEGTVVLTGITLDF